MFDFYIFVEWCFIKLHQNLTRVNLNFYLIFDNNQSFFASKGLSAIILTHKEIKADDSVFNKKILDTRVKLTISRYTCICPVQKPFFMSRFIRAACEKSISNSYLLTKHNAMSYRICSNNEALLVYKKKLIIKS